MAAVLMATLLLVAWPPTWTPDGKQIIESLTHRERIGSYNVTARYQVYDDGAVVIVLSHADISRPIVVLPPLTKPCDPYWADLGVLEKDGIRLRPPPEWDVPSWKRTRIDVPECQAMDEKLTDG